MTSGKIIIGYQGAEVMDVVEADVSREILKNPGEFIIRTSFKRNPLVIPFTGLLPERGIELMLHIEKPEPDYTRYINDRQLYQQESFDPDKHAH
jgi:hypothetical protein